MKQQLRRKSLLLKDILVLIGKYSKNIGKIPLVFGKFMIIQRWLLLLTKRCKSSALRSNGSGRASRGAKDGAPPHRGVQTRHNETGLSEG